MMMNHSQSDSDVNESVNSGEDSDSSSSSSSSSSGSSSSTNTIDGNALELAKINGEVLRLPRGLCENAAIFREFFSLDTWDLLPEEFQHQLQAYLPRFSHLLEPNEAASELQHTIMMLFAGNEEEQLDCFGQTPFSDLQRKLEEGNYRPDVLKLRQSIAKSRRRELRFQRCERLSQLAKQLFVSRERLLRRAYKSAPGVNLSERTLRKQHQPASLYADTKLSTVRACKRFHKEVQQMMQQLGLNSNDISADEQDDDNLMCGQLSEDLQHNSQKLQQNGTGSGAEEVTKSIAGNSSASTEKCIYSTLFKRRHYTMDDEEIVRAELYAKQPKLSNRNFRQYLLEHKRRKLTEPTLADFETSDIRLRDVCARAQMGGNFKRMFPTGKTPGRKPKAKIMVTEPPALVPIQATNLRNIENDQPKILVKQQTSIAVPSTTYGLNDALTLQHHQQQQQNDKLQVSASQDELGTNHTFMPVTEEDNEAFNIMDGEIELQQEEVETYAGGSGTCEETIPAFVISNEIALPQSEQLPENILQTPQKSNGNENTTLSNSNLSSITRKLCVDSREKQRDNAVIQQISGTSSNQLHNMPLSNMPKLEPIIANSNKLYKDKLASAVSGVVTKIATPAKVVNSLSGLNQQTMVVKRTSPSNATNTTAAAVATIPTVTVASYINTNAELIQETHACFFSLIRDFFCATPHHRMKYDDLKGKINIWLCNPITALNDWYTQAENWSLLLKSAINFLAGDFADLPDEYVPYIEYKTQLNIYQWIGAGRDSDTRLATLCNFWMQRRQERNEKLTNEQQKPDMKSTNLSTSESLLSMRRRSTEIEDINSNVDSSGGGITPPPPPRCPTTWTVRAATTEEVMEFQHQERERFENPHRAYTYRMHGFESVVGPVKGIYSQILALTKARGHSMMIGDRPNFVTILTLVRDATARLPNGEGTRADISELLKCSQYINRDAAENVLQTIVSGALDRMHTEHDPCVRYDPKRKIWIYLHRNRSETEFERMHQQYQGLAGKNKKSTNRKQKPLTATGTVTVAGGTATTKSLTKASINEADVLTSGINTGLTEHINNITTVTVPTANTHSFSLPALVPSNPIIVSNQATAIHQTSQQAPKFQHTMLSKCPPVPPLKYNIPPPQQQQQKSLLKTTVHMQRQQDGKLLELDQRNQARVQATGMTASGTVMGAKQFTFSMPQAKSIAVSSVGMAGNTTPILVATSAGLQTLQHVSTASTITTPRASQTTAAGLSATVGGKKVALNKPIIINQITQSPQQQLTNKAIKTQITKQQLNQQQAHSFIIPISMNSKNVLASSEQQTQKIITTASSDGKVIKERAGIQTIFMDNSQLIAATTANVADNTAGVGATAKNIIRLVPTINTSGVKTLTQVVTPQHQSAGQQQQRIITNTGLRSSAQQKIITGAVASSSGGISIITSNSVAASTQANSNSSGTIVKMSPQAFASLQQKQGQHYFIKQATAGATSQHPQRVLVGNTAIIAQPSSGHITTNKNIVVQQIPAPTLQHTQKAAVLTSTGNTTALSVGSQTAGGLSISTTAAAGTANSSSITATTANKIQTINASNLTPQQQRVLMQNLKQQSQHIQFKTVQVVASAAQQQQQQQQHTEGTSQIARSQAVTVISPQRAAAATVAGKTVTVMITQPQGNAGITRLVKTTANSQQQLQHKQQHIITANSAAASNAVSGGTRVLTNASGQIISLESLLQKQGGALKITSGNATKSAQTTNIIQLASSTVPQGTTQYAVLPQHSRNIISLGGTSQRLVTTQAGSVNSMTTVLTSPMSVAAAVAAKEVPKVTDVSGRIITSTGQIIQNVTSNTNKVLTSKAAGIVTASMGNGSVTPGGNIRVVNTAATSAANLNIANIQGKHVVFATKSGTTLTSSGTVKNMANMSATQASQLQNASVIIGGHAVKLQGNNQLAKSGILTTKQQPANTSQMQTVIMGNQILRVQQIQQNVKPTPNRVTAAVPVITSMSNATTNATVTVKNNEAILNTSSNVNMPKTLVLGNAAGQTIRLQPAHSIANATSQQHQQQQNINMKTSNASRVVLAVQGGGQIFLSPSFQGAGGTLNLKSLQNMKVVSLAQSSATTTGTELPQQDKLTLATTTIQRIGQQSILKSSSGTTTNSTGSGAG